MILTTKIRTVLHRPYLRAAAVGLSLALTAVSLGALRLRLEHGVSLTAVTRYFTRSHLKQADLAPLLRHWEVGLQIETLLEPASAGWVGGLVYADGDLLVFHPVRDAGRRRAWLAERENRLLYARLVPLYHRGALDELILALGSTQVQRALAARGVDATSLSEIRAALPEARSEPDRIRLLRRAAPLIQPFTPVAMSSSWLGLGDRLRFYESSDPPGEFVGQFSLLDPGWGSRFDEREALELSEHNHYILITRAGDRILLLDFFRGEVRRFDLRPFDHDAGHRLYQLTVAG